MRIYKPFRSFYKVVFALLICSFFQSINTTAQISNPTELNSTTYRTYSSSDLLQSAKRKHESNLAQIKAQNELSLPEKQWIDQMEFRTEFNELDLNQQEYLFRMRFRNDKIRVLQNELLTMQKTLLEQESVESIDDGAELIYKHIVSLYYNLQRDSLTMYKLKLLTDKNAVESTLFQTDVKANFNDVLKIKERQIEIKKQIYELQSEKETALITLGITDTTSPIQVSELISLPALEKVISSQQDYYADQNLYESRLAIIQKEYELEQQDTETLLRFAQLKYKANDNQGIPRELSLGLGFTLPYKQVDKNNLAKLELEKIEEQFKQQEEQISIEGEIVEEKIELEKLIKKYNYELQLYKEENLNQLKEEYLRSERVQAIPLINLELMIIDRQLQLMDIQEDIYQQYISTLDRYGVLDFRYNTNWLDQSLKPIE